MQSLQETGDIHHCIDVCNSLLRGEISAVETYDKAIEKFSADPKVGELRSIRRDHAKSVQDLQLNVVAMNGIPSDDSGAWGSFIGAAQIAANLCGENAAVASLIKGEEYGQSQYLEALDDELVMPDCKVLIRSILCPRVNDHILALKTLQRTI